MALGEGHAIADSTRSSRRQTKRLQAVLHGQCVGRRRRRAGVNLFWVLLATLLFYLLSVNTTILPTIYSWQQGTRASENPKVADVLDVASSRAPVPVSDDASQAGDSEEKGG
eukprot:1261853-Pyramimonas_sp.AAC.1